MTIDILITLFATITLGLLLGRIQVAGISLGSSGVIFVALVMGHFDRQLPPIIGTLGLVLFVYCLGVSTGPGFIRAVTSQGKALVALGCCLVVVGVIVCWGCAKLFGIPPDLAGGIFAGAMTSTPALAAASEALPPDAKVAVGFGLGYPFGVFAVVLFVQLLPRLLGTSFEEMNREIKDEHQESLRIQRELVRVVNPSVVGKRISQLSVVDRSNCQVTRVMRENHLTPVPADFTLQIGQQLLVIGPKQEIKEVIEVLGENIEQPDYILDAERQRMKVVVSSRELVHKSLHDLKLLSRFGVTISRINRHDVEFVPRPTDKIEKGDALFAVGEPQALQAFAQFAGHQEKFFFETDLVSVAFGVLLGILVGKIEIQLGGQVISLGLAGGPLLVGLVLGHFGKIGPLVGHIPRASRMLMTELGLVFFLASAGVRAGADLTEVVQQQGIMLCVAALIIAFAPLVVGFLFSRYVLGMNLFETLGGVCGGMTSTPGLGLLAAKADSNIPTLSYATIYPVALILMTLLGRVLVEVLA